MSELIEKLAKLEHEQWVHWVKYMAENFTKENMERWERQIKTPYEKLSEEEKEKDRMWAKKVLVALGVLCSKCGEEMVEAGVNLYACPKCSEKVFGMFGVPIPKGKLE